MSAMDIAKVGGGQMSLAERDIARFEDNLRGELLHPGDPGYEEARRIWNGLIDRRPALIARCTDLADVVEAVNFARSYQLLITVRGSGYGVSGNAVCDGGLVVDLSSLKNVDIDKDARIARAEGGVIWHELDSGTQELGLVVPGSMVSQTGIAGLTLGGGMGWLRRKFGLTCDSLHSAEVVTAAGDVVTASAKENADLFWGLRGGGGNLGIVTSFEFDLHLLGPMLMSTLVNYPASRAREALRFFRQYVTEAPDEASTLASLWTIPADPAFPLESYGQRAILLGACHAGAVDDGEETLRPLREFDKPLADASGVLPYVELQRAFDDDYPAGRFYYWNSLYLDTLENEIIDTILNHWAQCPSMQSAVSVWHLGGAISRVAPEDTAFAFRNAPYLLNIKSCWTDPRTTEENIAWTRRFWSDMQPYSAGGIYANFWFANGQQQLARAIYGPNYDRLVALKDKYDPENFFRMNQNIEPAT